MSTDIEEYDVMQQVGELVMEGNNLSQIASSLNITPYMAKKYRDNWRSWLAREAQENTDFTERAVQLVFETLENYDKLKRELWQTVEYCEDNDLPAQKITALKSIAQIEKERAHVLQTSGIKADSHMVARMHKAERVNEGLSKILKEVVVHCDNCRAEVFSRLSEFMQDFNGTVHPVDIIDAEVVEDNELNAG